MIFDVLWDWSHAVTNYQPIVTGYHNTEIIYAVFRGLEITVGEVQVEENVRRSTRQRGMFVRLQDCELFPDK